MQKSSGTWPCFSFLGREGYFWTNWPPDLSIVNFAPNPFLLVSKIQLCFLVYSSSCNAILSIIDKNRFQDLKKVTQIQGMKIQSGRRRLGLIFRHGLLSIISLCLVITRAVTQAFVFYAFEQQRTQDQIVSGEPPKKSNITSNSKID